MRDFRLSALRDILHRQASPVANGMSETDTPPSIADGNARDRKPACLDHNGSFEHVAPGFTDNSCPFHVGFSVGERGGSTLAVPDVIHSSTIHY